MNVLMPTTITDAMLTSSTIAEPAAGETAWVSAGTYALGDRRIRTTTHRIYECVTAHSGRTTYPEDDTAYWIEYAPTAKWAMFDTAVSTQSSISTPLTVVLKPGNFNSLALYGLDAATLTVTVKDSTGGTTVYSSTDALQEPPLDWYDWAFGAIKQLTKIVKTGITPYPNAELTVTLSASAGTIKAGMLVVGDYRSLIYADGFGGLLAGATAEPVDFSYIKTDDFGNTKIIKRRNATDLKVTVWIPREDADYALSVLQSVLATPCAWVASETAGFLGLNTFGLGSGSLAYADASHAIFTINVKGLV